MIQLRLLGGLGLTDPDGRTLGSVLAQPKRVALLAYLALARPRGFHRRDRLLALFWPESDQERGRAALSQAIYYLRRSLGDSIVASRGIDELGVSPTHLWTDVATFESAVGSGQTRIALDLYEGELLPAFHLRDAPDWERWLDAERARLCALACETAWSAADDALAAGAFDDALRLARQGSDLAPYDEAGIRRLIRLIERINGRAAALRAYEEAASRLDQDLEVEPSAETKELIAGIRTRDADTSGPPDHERRVSARPATPPPASTVVRALPGRSPSAGRLRTFGRLGATLATIGVLLATGLFLRAMSSTGDQVTAPPPVPASLRRVAVLPFANLSGDAAGGYLAAGTADELRRRLSGLGDVLILAGSSMARYRTTDLGARQIGAELDVGTLVEGGVRESGDRIRVTVYLVDVASETTIWSRDFEGDSGEILDLQTDIADAVARALGVSVRDDALRRLATSGTRDPVAFRLYLAGRERLGYSNHAAVIEARDYFERAVAVDSGFARAWAGLADVYDELAGMNVVPSTEAYRRSRSLAESALARDPGLAEAHGSLAHALAVYFWDFELATHHFRRAIELDPSDARSRRAYASHLRNLGRYDEARLVAATALEVAPRNFFAGIELGIISYFEGRFGEATEQLRRIIAQGPTFAYGNAFLALALSQQELHDEAIEAIEALGHLASLPDPLTIRGYVLARAGRTTEARNVLAALDELAPGGVGFEFGRAVVHLGLGEHDLALDLLDQAAAARDWHVILIRGEPIFDPLRSDPRFESLLAHAGLTR
jgi:DNA-binding SARP family transcriptional activator/TolB-like protein/Flp pilus assembly protein TadD